MVTIRVSELYRRCEFRKTCENIRVTSKDINVGILQGKNWVRTKMGSSFLQKHLNVCEVNVWCIILLRCPTVFMSVEDSMVCPCWSCNKM